MDKIPVPKRPGEVICFFPVEFPTKQGDVYIFVAKDIYSETLIQTGVEGDNTIDQVLKHLALLMQDESFAEYGNKPFTLVLHKYGQYREKINEIIAPYGGTLVVDDLYLTSKMIDVIEFLYKTIMGPNPSDN